MCIYIYIYIQGTVFLYSMGILEIDIIVSGLRKLDFQLDADDALSANVKQKDQKVDGKLQKIIISVSLVTVLILISTGIYRNLLENKACAMVLLIFCISSLYIIKVAIKVIVESYRLKRKILKKSEDGSNSNYSILFSYLLSLSRRAMVGIICLTLACLAQVNSAFFYFTTEFKPGLFQKDIIE